MQAGGEETAGKADGEGGESDSSAHSSSDGGDSEDEAAARRGEQERDTDREEQRVKAEAIRMAKAQREEYAPTLISNNNLPERGYSEGSLLHKCVSIGLVRPFFLVSFVEGNPFERLSLRLIPPSSA